MYETTAQLLEDLLFRASEPTDGSSEFEDAALRYINRAYQAVWMGGSELEPTINEEWWWLRKHPPGVLTLEPAISDGTVAVVNGSTGITFSVAPSSSVAGRFLRALDGRDVFRVQSHTAGQTAAVLDGPYTGDTGSVSYRLMRLEYDLAADVLRPISPMRPLRGYGQIDGMDLLALEKRWPLSRVQGGLPDAFAPIHEVDGVVKVRFNRYGGAATTELIRVEYDYLFKPAALTGVGAEEPVVPHQYRRLLADAALYFLHIDKNDDRADAAGLLARNGLKAMQIEHKHKMATVTGEYAAIRPRASETSELLRTTHGLVIPR